ncbi:ATP binding microtubule motor family protein [Forsythia ovata]|uniref:ATP binding microtubule motor family protein n=1 Tax=Forsythia ovata TaxID=205694 RepID=A0ABD1VK40_9LAMI
MGTIGGEELVDWDKRQGIGNGTEEKILVFVRLRPLSEKEIVRNEAADWECINTTTILYQHSFKERSGLPPAYTFDRVFRGDCSTREVYLEGIKDVALSTVSGINSTIFAYGQTSSGKTYTMNGITQYTVADIYSYTQKHEERAFVLKFSALEIYNEVVRDLLSADNTPLRLLDDAERETVIEKLTEETLRDWGHLKELLSVCEAKRQIGETSLNETSSRSHQILRLTIESSARDSLGKDNSTTLAATVNFVDLAGSERASQALSAGQRLKEGCHINRSLLILGTVIRKLSKGRHGHVNYRDSKLTRILQPALGGNARTAIICTLSPTRSHAEQSRNTLLFASCAKEVTTNAQVNVVMSDKALVKHLQKEVARLESELRTPGPACDHIALLRKKDTLIEKLEKEVRELTKQQELAQSRVEDLLQVVGNDKTLWKMDAITCSPKWKEENTYKDEWSVTSMSCGTDCATNLNRIRSYNRDIRSDGTSDVLLSEDGEYHSSSDGPSDLSQGREELPVGTEKDSDDICKEVGCIEMDEYGHDKTCESFGLSNNENEEIMSILLESGNGEAVDQEPLSALPGHASVVENGSSYGMLEQKIEKEQRTISSLVSSYPDELSPRASFINMPSSGTLKLTRSQSKLTTGSSHSEMADKSESTPPSGLEKSFPGRPEGFQKKHLKLLTFIYGANGVRLSRNDSQSSSGSSSIEEVKAQNITHGEEKIPTLGSFLAGLQDMAELQYENQFHDQVHEIELKSRENVKDVGIDPMHDSLGAPSDWPLKFERLQRSIIELWNTCIVPLVHRTYFFLLFKGDLIDSIYMEVEHRRLSFLKETFSMGNPTAQDGRTLTLALSNSTKALRREREMLRRLMYKRYMRHERCRIYQKWGIKTNSKQRRLQLVHRLWSDTKDMDHIGESAAIVAKLIGFSEQGQGLKEMFGLTFIPPGTSPRSFSWKKNEALEIINKLSDQVCVIPLALACHREQAHQFLSTRFGDRPRKGISNANLKVESKYFNFCRPIALQN